MPVAADESFSRVSASQLRADGIASLIRYVTGSGKAISASELQTLLAAEISVCLVMETFEQAASMGFTQGMNEARSALAAADSVGWPADRPIYFVAEDPRPVARTAWGSVSDYFAGVNFVLGEQGRPWRPGAYGSGALCGYLVDSGLVGLEWHVSTWPGADRSRAALVQEANGLAGYSTLGGAIDLDSINPSLADWGQYPFHTQVPEDEMAVRYALPNGQVYVTDGLSRRYVGTPQDNDVLNDIGVKLVSIAADHIQAFHAGLHSLDGDAGGSGLTADAVADVLAKRLES